MSASVLGHLTLGYQWVWNSRREVAAVQLFVQSDAQAPVDATHLLALIAQTWTGRSPRLILSVQSTPLLADLLHHAPADGPWLALQAEQLEHPLIAAQLLQTGGVAAPLLWRGAPGERPPPALRAGLLRSMVSLSAGEALLALHEARHLTNRVDPAPSVRRNNPILPDQIVESIGSGLLAAYCLDHCGAWGVAGWPVEDVIFARRQQPVGASQRDILRLLKAVEADAAMDRIEALLAREPLLCYRFLRHANSAELGLRNPVESLRHGLMILGLSKFTQWLLEQLAHASTDVDLQPVRTMITVRTQLMEQLLDAGDEDTLRREVTLCGLLSQIDLLSGEPLKQALQRIAVPERVLSAILGNSGPYAPYLHIATALEHPATHKLPELCAAHGIDIGDVNRTLLRVLSQARTDT